MSDDPPTTCVKELVKQMPELQPLLGEHLNDNSEILPHVFFGDVTRYVIDEVRSGKTGPKDPPARIMKVLDECLGREDSVDGYSMTKDLIAASFLENLVDHPDVLRWVENSFGPNFKKEFGGQ